MEVVRQVAEIDEDDPPDRAAAKVLGSVGDQDVADRVASATGTGQPMFPWPSSSGRIRRLVEILAEREPLVLVIDDIHWAEPTLLELIEHLSEAVIEVPVLVAVHGAPRAARGAPRRGAKGRARSGSSCSPLGDDRGGRDRGGPAGSCGLPASAILDRITTAAEGNPLFVEQLRLDARRRGQRSGASTGDWRLADEVGELAVPPTIQALLAARLDRLGREERAVIEPASVIGLGFPRAALPLAGARVPRRGHRQRHLASLDRKQLVHPGCRQPSHEPSYRFHHILIRDTSLQQPPQASPRRRSTSDSWSGRMHATRERPGLEFEEILGYHLEQAHRYLAELGPLDDARHRAGPAASDRLAAAGRPSIRARRHARDRQPAATRRACAARG